MAKKEGIANERATRSDPIDDVTAIPDEFKHAAAVRLLGAKLDSEDHPCGLEDIVDMLALRETDIGDSNFLKESLD